MDFFKMYDEVKKFESDYEKEQINKEISSTESKDRSEESDITEETKEERKELEETKTEEKRN